MKEESQVSIDDEQFPIPCTSFIPRSRSSETNRERSSKEMEVNYLVLVLSIVVLFNWD